MLSELRIANLALIEEACLDLGGTERGLVVLTGETGAGKSIIMQGLRLLGGGRAARGLARDQSKGVELAAVFSVGGPGRAAVRRILEEHGLEPEEVCVIRRRISPSGRSRYAVNDRPCTSRPAAALLAALVDVAAQRDQQVLLDASRHLDFLDAVGDLHPLRQDYAQAFGRWRKAERLCRDLREMRAEREQRLDFLRFQINEISEAEPRPGEDEELARERDRLKAADTLIRCAGRALGLVEGHSLTDLAEARKLMEQAADLDGGAAELAGRLATLVIELEDTALEIRRYAEDIPRESARLEVVGERLAVLNRLKRKYGGTLESVLEHRDRAVREAEDLEHAEERLEEAAGRAAAARKEVLDLAARLGEARRAAARALEQAMEAELGSLSFLQAAFQVRMDQVEPGPTGQDQVEFLFSANPGHPPQPLARIASGGELSRLLLAMKCVLARRDEVETVVFDEVDAGISGAAAEAVADKICELAGHHQVICITHLPQIAARAHLHCSVRKQVDQGETRTRIVPLDRAGRVEELARMLGGDGADEQSRSYARALLAREACS